MAINGNNPWFWSVYHIEAFWKVRIVASYIQLRDLRMISQELGRIDLASIAWIGV